MVDRADVLSLPTVARVRYERNFIKTAVCELRFPTLLGLETEPPRTFHQSVRRLYPLYERQVVPVATTEALNEEVRYLFRSKDKQWTLTVKSYALALETSKYVDFRDFRQRLEVVIDRAKPLIDSDFFTRVGLRYINWIPIEDDTLAGWIRRELVPPFGDPGLGEPRQYACQIEGRLNDGQYTIRQGLRTESSMGDTDQPKRVFVWDVDYFKENVEAEELLPVVQGFNDTNFAFFSWSMGEKAIAAMGKATPK